MVLNKDKAVLTAEFQSPQSLLIKSQRSGASGVSGYKKTFYDENHQRKNINDTL